MAKVNAKNAIKNAPSTLTKLRAAHPDAHCELDHHSAFELLVATVDRKSVV